ncbi:class I SAM-dependent methyltransferase [Crenothrix polyspora]|jgi:SAM-dependent methyltransferase|uniref:Methyltransferase type 11 n=1 Tax=Crenothrix polyspora TaxID=360316 RepID=A0A1R4H4L1_9GAMM|nr:methyltransferase domain-containing protein [Crenothrix polyspora]SJM91208.1 Methyltransferase type 11 [Crenothrix polyspora]
MKRNFLFAWYQTPRGKLQKQLEIDYLQRSITVSCKQIILQIGGLGWENEFIDCSLYTNYTVVDTRGLGYEGVRKIRAKAHHLPLQSDSVDMIIVPHLLEFDMSRFQTMREIERILKPEGIVVILNFNPLSIWVRYQYIWDRKMADSWRGHFISRARILDWLKLLDFDVISLAQFNLNSVKSTYSQNINASLSFLATAYAVKAVKRRYGIIPMTPVKNRNFRLVMGSTVLCRHDGKHD